MRHRPFTLPTHRWITPVVITALLVTGSTLGHASTAAAAPAPAPSHGPTSPQENAAVQKARDTGQPVEVDGQQTTNTTVLANPDGHFTYRATALPERVNKDGAWHAIDPTLTRRGDGLYAPTASTTNVAFSNGGTTPLVTLMSGDKKLTLSWPTPLPTPQVASATATYPGVLPGVDLQLTATAQSYREILIVHDATAAKNPALATITLDAATTGGLSLSTAPSGALNATDPTGHVVFVGSTPVMWDSRHDPGQPIPTAADPGATTHLTVALTSGAAGHTTLAITPDPAALTGPDVVYPAYIDPTTSDVGTTDWGDVTSKNPHDNNDYRGDDVRVGRCHNFVGECNGDWLSRGFFIMPTGALQARNGVQAQIRSAHFTIADLHTYAHSPTGCNPIVFGWNNGAFNSTTSWPGPGPFTGVDTQTACEGSDPVRFTATSMALTVVQYNLAAISVALQSDNEAAEDNNHWNRFANNPTLTVEYLFAPNAATNTAISRAVACTGTLITPDNQPTLQATATDNNPQPEGLNLDFEVWTGDGVTRVVASPDIHIASGTIASWQVTTPLTDGAWAYRVNVRNDDAAWAPNWSPWTNFTVHSTPPPSKPEVTSSDYGTNYWGPNTGRITIHTPDPTVLGITYSFTGPGTEPVPITTNCAYTRYNPNIGGWAGIDPHDPGFFTITIPPGFSPGYHTLNVRSFDDAHNLSPGEAAYSFYVAPEYGAPTGTFEGETATITQPAGQNVPTVVQDQGGWPGLSWSGGHQLLFQGTAAGQSFTVPFTAPDTDPNGITYNLGLGLTKSNDYGILAFKVDNQPLAQPFDGFNPTVISYYQPLGGIHLTPGQHQLTITLTGTSSATVGARYFAGLDYLRLAPTQQYEAEDPTQLVLKPTSVVTSTQTGGPTGTHWSGNAQLLISATAAGQSCDFTFHTTLDADFALAVRMTQAPGYGQITFALDGHTLANTDTTPFDGYHKDTIVSTVFSLGGAHLSPHDNPLTPGNHTLTLTIAGTNPASTGARYAAGLDYLLAAPINNINAGTFTQAMNNHGLNDDDHTDRITDDQSLDLNGSALSSQTMAAAGLAPGNTITVQGATFTLPAANKDTNNDNVIASGQTITLSDDQKIKASAIGLLAASTCGDTPHSTAAVAYETGALEKPEVPGVPDWATPVWGSLPATVATPVVRLPYGNAIVGRDSTGHVYTGRDTVHTPTLYAVFLPTDPTRKLQQITLPNIRTAFRTAPGGCPDTALHILAIAPRPLNSLSPSGTAWAGAWAQPADTTTAPPSGGLADKTLRVIAHPAITGTGQARIRLSNTGSPTPVTIDAATLAAQTTGAATTAAPTVVKFNHQATVTIPAGGDISSDPIPLPTTPGGSGSLAVSLHLPNQTITTTPAHTANGTITYLAPGNTTTNQDGTPYTSQSGTTLPASYYLTGIDVTTPAPDPDNNPNGTIAILADQNTSTPGNPTAWGDTLAAGLGTKLPGGVVTITHTTPPPPAWWTAQNQTTLAEPRLRTVIVTLGAQDILNGTDPQTLRAKLIQLISDINGFNRYKRPKGDTIHIVLSTIPPLGLDPNDTKEKNRQLLNADITDNFDTGYGADIKIDVDQALRDPLHPSAVDPNYLTNGTPKDSYYQRIAQTITQDTNVTGAL